MTPTINTTIFYNFFTTKPACRYQYILNSLSSSSHISPSSVFLTTNVVTSLSHAVAPSPPLPYPYNMVGSSLSKSPILHSCHHLSSPFPYSVSASSPDPTRSASSESRFGTTWPKSPHCRLHLARFVVFAALICLRVSAFCVSFTSLAVAELRRLDPAAARQREADAAHYVVFFDARSIKCVRKRQPCSNNKNHRRFVLGSRAVLVMSRNNDIPSLSSFSLLHVDFLLMR